MFTLSGSADRQDQGRRPAAAGAGADAARRDIASEFGTAIVRVFSFFIPPGDPAERHRHHVQCGVQPHAEGYGLLRPYLVYLQIKDAVAATGVVVPAGQGDGQLRETLTALADSGFDGYLSLEPHLAQAGRYGGFSGPEGFHRAAQALKSLLDDIAAPRR